MDRLSLKERIELERQQARHIFFFTLSPLFELGQRLEIEAENSTYALPFNAGSKFIICNYYRVVFLAFSQKCNTVFYTLFAVVLLKRIHWHAISNHFTVLRVYHFTLKKIIFDFPRMSLTKLSLAGNNLIILLCSEFITLHCKIFFSIFPGCHSPNSPWRGII